MDACNTKRRVKITVGDLSGCPAGIQLEILVIHATAVITEMNTENEILNKKKKEDKMSLIAKIFLSWILGLIIIWVYGFYETFREYNSESDKKPFEVRWYLLTAWVGIPAILGVVYMWVYL